jgi:hypothetical protein
VPPFAIDRTAHMNAALRNQGKNLISYSAPNSLITDCAIALDSVPCQERGCCPPSSSTKQTSRADPAGINPDTAPPHGPNNTIGQQQCTALERRGKCSRWYHNAFIDVCMCASRRSWYMNMNTSAPSTSTTVLQPTRSRLFIYPHLLTCACNFDARELRREPSRAGPQSSVQPSKHHRPEGELLQEQCDDDSIVGVPSQPGSQWIPMKK